MMEPLWSLYLQQMYLQIGGEVTGRRRTLESWREGPHADHVTAPGLPGPGRSKSESTGRKTKRAIKEGRTPGKRASRCGRTVWTSQNLGTVINLTMPIGV